MPSTPAPRGPAIKTDTAVNCAVAVTPLAVANASVAGSRPTCSPHVDLSVSTPPTVGRGGKRQSKTGRLVPRQDSKRARHTVARNLYGAGRLDCEEKENEDDSELESTMQPETETETESEILGESCEDPGSDQRVEAPPMQEGVSGDGIVWPCAGANPLERSLSFVEHLKTAVELVDAENCSPLPGMKCMQGCVRIRTRMCQLHRTQGGNARVYHDKMCYVWRVIDTHLVRCRNIDCEFKNRVGLRQAMHDIQQNQLKLEAITNKLLAAKAMVQGVDGDAVGALGSSASQIESKIKRLEEKCIKLEDAVLLHKDRERAFKFVLNALEIPANSELDEMPSFPSHYARKRPRE